MFFYLGEWQVVATKQDGMMAVWEWIADPAYVLVAADRDELVLMQRRRHPNLTELVAQLAGPNWKRFLRNDNQRVSQQISR